MTYQKCPVLLMCHDSISEGFFHTPLRAGAAPESWQPKIAASIEKYRLTCADSGARGKQFLRREYPTLAYSTRGCWLAPAPASRPLPPPPHVEQSPSPRGGRRAFFGILGRSRLFRRDSGQPGSLNHGIQTGAISPGDGRLLFQSLCGGKQTSQIEHFWFWTQLGT
jgi:hypothetical protein